MRRLLCSIAVGLTLVSAVAVSAQENPVLPDTQIQEEEQPTPQLAAWSAELSLVYSMSRLGRYVSTNPVAIWSRAWYRFGAGGRIMIGTSQFDVHGVPFVRLGAGPVSIDAGWVFELIDETSAYQLVDNGPFGALAFEIPALKLGIGSFGVTFGVEAFFPLWPDEEQPSLAGANLLADSWSDPTLADLARNITGRTMARLGVLYTFPL